MTNKLSDKQLDQIVRRTPLGKLNDTDDVANIFEYLVSKKAKSVTGQLIKVDNGITV